MKPNTAGHVQAEAEAALHDLVRVFGYDNAIEVVAALMNTVNLYGQAQATEIIAMMLLKERARR